MKKIVLPILISAIAFSCKKEEKRIDHSSQNDTSVTVAADSPVADSTAAKLSENKPFKVNTLNEDAALGKVIFSQNNQVIIAFNTESQTGKIVIDDREYALNELTFAETNYEISGSGVKITAENGNFKEMTSDCLYGTFPKVKITLNDKDTSLENVNVQDCPAY